MSELFMKDPGSGLAIPVDLFSRINGATVPVDIVVNDEGTEEPPPTNMPPNKVTINGVSRKINAINTFRGVNEIVLYTPDYATITPTNQYGTEVTVVNNQVTSVVDRNAFGPVTGTNIPSNGYVLSGHEDSNTYPNTSAKWLRDNATIGAQVVLSYDPAIDDSDPPVDPEDPPVDPNDPGAPNIPGELSIWQYGFSDSWRGVARTYSDYPLSFYNALDVIIISMGQSAQSGTGYLTDPVMMGYPSVAAAKKANQDFIASGSNKRVLFGFGGSNDGGITLKTTQHADQMFSSIQRVIGNWGVNGISIDMEGAPGTTWTKEAMTYLCQKLKQTYGNSFFVDACFALYGSSNPATNKNIQWPAFLKYAGDAVDRASVMLYDFDEAADNRLINVTVDKLRILHEGGVKLSKAVMLYAARPGTWEYPRSTPTAQLVIDAVKAGKAQYGAQGYDGKYGWWEDKALWSQTPRFNMALQAMAAL